MNEITAAIKKKAEEKYPYPENASASYRSVQLLKQAGYTCGGEDAIGFMLKFVEWVDKKRWCLVNPELNDGIWTNRIGAYGKKVGYTTEQLLLKYMEENKL